MNILGYRSREGSKRKGYTPVEKVNISAFLMQFAATVCVSFGVHIMKKIKFHENV